jgi:hypothetical protein
MLPCLSSCDKHQLYYLLCWKWNYNQFVFVLSCLLLSLWKLLVMIMIESNKETPPIPPVFITHTNQKHSSQLFSHSVWVVVFFISASCLFWPFIFLGNIQHGCNLCFKMFSWYVGLCLLLLFHFITTIVCYFSRIRDTPILPLSTSSYHFHHIIIRFMSNCSDFMYR